jgi:hypothetical protein
VVREVAVRIDAKTAAVRGLPVVGPGSSPLPVRSTAVLVAVGVQHGQNVDVDPLQQLAVLRVVQQLNF